MKRLIIATALLALTLSAEEPKTPSESAVAEATAALKSAKATIESQSAKIAHLEAQLSELRLTFQYEQQVCSLPDLMRARLATMETKAATEAMASRPVSGTLTDHVVTTPAPKPEAAK